MSYKNLEKKYNQRLPRYTSYPSVLDWNSDKPDLTNFDLSDIGLYIHIPFCQKLCYYCGCHKVISRTREKTSLPYVDALLREWSLYAKKVQKISYIHFGGGTPNFLPHDEFERIFQTLLPKLSSHLYASIELDPRTLQTQDLTFYKNLGFKKISMGIQDFNPKVQEHINRVQSFEMIKKHVLKARELKLSINFDLIWGLPYQSVHTMEETIEQVLKLVPDEIALYSYAHLPHLYPAQKLLHENEIADGLEKRKIYDRAKELLGLAGYHEVGMDHFCHEQSELYQSYAKQTMTRSFMGHHPGRMDTMIGLGASAISSGAFGFVQNTKDVKSYMQRADSSERFEKTHKAKPHESYIAQMISHILCYKKIPKDYLRVFKRFYPNHANEFHQRWKEFERDGLIKKNETELPHFELTQAGQIFLRTVAASFDPHLYQENRNQGYSKVI